MTTPQVVVRRLARILMLTLATACAASSGALAQAAEGVEPYAFILSVPGGLKVYAKYSTGGAERPVDALPCALPREASLRLEGEGEVVLSLPRGRRTLGADAALTDMRTLNSRMAAKAEANPTHKALETFMLGGVNRSDAKAGFVHPPDGGVVQAGELRVVFPADWPMDSETTLTLERTGARTLQEVAKVKTSQPWEAPADWTAQAGAPGGATLTLQAKSGERVLRAKFRVLDEAEAAELERELAACATEVDPLLRRVARAHVYEAKGLVLAAAVELRAAVQADEARRFRLLQNISESLLARHGLAQLRQF